MSNAVVKEMPNSRARVWCPGCETSHVIDLGLWEWDGGVERPSFHPSLLIYRTVGPENTPERCHSFIRDGKWQYLSDSTHALAGLTVPMVPIGSIDDLS